MKTEHCEHIYCGICIKKGREQALEEVEKIIDESIPKKLIELEKMRATVEGHHPNLSKSEMIKNELKSKIKELNK